MRSFKLSNHPIEQSNIHHLVLDIFWFGLALPATTRFLSAYATRLGADASELSLLTSLPAIVLFFSASLAGRWMSRYTESVRALIWPSLIHRLSFLLPALTPFMPPDWQPMWLILSLTLPAFPQGIANIAFLVTLRDAVEDQQIGPLTSRRSLTLNMAVGLSGLALGVWLEKAPFPFNYQAMFVLAFILVLFSLWHVSKVHVLRSLPTVNSPTPLLPFVTWRSPNFQQVGFVTALMYTCFFAALALVQKHLIDNLDATEGFIALFGLAELTAGAMAALYTNRIIHYLGNRTTMALSMIITAIGMLIIALALNLNVTLLAAALSGAAWTAANIALFTYFSESTPADDKPRYTTAWTQTMSLSTFVGPLIGSGLSSVGFNLVTILLIGAGLRLVAGVLIQPYASAWIKRTVHLVEQTR